MIRFCLIFLFLLCTETLSFAAGPPVRPEFISANAEQEKIISRVLGTDFSQVKGVFPSELMVAEVDLNTDKQIDLIVVQKALCSNHACSFEVLLNRGDDAWDHVTSIDSWAIPYLIQGSGQDFGEIIRFDHLSDDCSACSEPTPLRLVWQLSCLTKIPGQFVEVGPLSQAEAVDFRPGFDWNASALAAENDDGK